MPLPKGYNLDAPPTPPAPSSAGLPSGYTLDSGAGTTQTPTEASPTPPAGTGSQDGATWKDYTGVGDLESLGIGFARGAARTVAGPGEMVNRLIGRQPNAFERGVTQFANEENANIGESVGTGIETVAEFMLGDELLKGLSFAQKLSKVTPALKILEKTPPLLEAALNGIRQGAVGTAQSLVHGEPLSQALTTGAVTGLTGTALEAGTAGVQKVINRIRPDTVTIAGEEMPRMASQRTTGAASKVGGPTEEMREAQQAGTQKGVRNMAQQATKDSIERLNAGRTPAGVTEPSRLLQQEPFTFDIAGTEPRTGTELTRAGTTAPEPHKYGFTTTDPHEAQQVLSRLEQLRDSPDFADFTQAQKKVVNDAHDSLRSQFDMYYSQFDPSSISNFRPVDADAAASGVRNFADAADQIEMGAKPVYQKLDELSEGRWTGFREQRKTAMKVMRSPSSVEAYDKASDSLAEADAGIDRIFRDSQQFVAPKELQLANNAWRDAKTLDKLHTVVEGSFNSIPENIAERTGLPRRIRGGVLQTRLGTLLAKTPQADIERVIGGEGLDNLYRIAHLLQDPENATETGNLLKEVTRHMTRRVGRGALYGGAIGSIFGMTGKGALAGAAAEDALRFAFRTTATEPRVGKMVDFAVKHKVSPRIAAPLIASVMSRPAPEDQSAPEPTP